MKAFIKKLSVLFAMGALVFGSGLLKEETKVASAAETVYKTLLFGADYNSGKISSYTSTWTATNDDLTWTIVNANNNNNGWSYIKIGRKNYASVGTITTNTAIDKAVTKINVKVDAVTTSKINSTYLYISDDATFNTSDTKVTVTAATGTLTYAVPETTIGANKYYQLVYDCASGSSDGLIQISKVEVYVDDSIGGDEGLTDEEKIAAVETAIDEIGTVANTAESKELIDTARSAYDALSDELKSSVSNYQDLLDAETTYEGLVNQAAADAVISLLEDLPEANEIVDYSYASEIKAARTAYDALTVDQMNLVNDQLVDKLEAVEAALEQYAPVIETATITFDSTSKRTVLTTAQQVWTENGVTVTNNKSSSTSNVIDSSNPVRFYANSELIISYVKEMTKIEITANNSSYATALKNSITSGATVTVSDSVVTVELTAPSTSFTISKLSAQARVDSITVYYTSSGEDETPVYPTDFELSASSMSLIVGESSSVTVTEYIGEGITATNVSWSTENTDIIDLNTGNGSFTALEVGTATITVSVQTGEETYLPKTCVVTVNPKPASRYNATLITDASTIEAGDKIAIVATGENAALGEEQKTNNRAQVTIEKDENGIFEFINEVEIITIEAGTTEGSFAFKTDEGYLYAASSSDNYLKSKQDLDANGSWTIEITEGVATIKATGTNNRNWIRYNSSSDLFSCYASGQGDISIYKVESDYNLFVTDLLATNPCLNDAVVANELQERYECLSEENKAAFNNATVSETDSTLLSERLTYIKTMAGVVDNVEGLSSNLLSNLTSSNNTLIVLIVGLLGLTSILGYYFLNKKKYSC